MVTFVENNKAILESKKVNNNNVNNVSELVQKVGKNEKFGVKPNKNKRNKGLSSSYECVRRNSSKGDIQEKKEVTRVHWKDMGRTDASLASYEQK